MPIGSFDHLWAETAFQARAVDPRLLRLVDDRLMAVGRGEGGKKRSKSISLVFRFALTLERPCALPKLA